MPVPHLRARSVLWDRGLSVELVKPLYALTDVEISEFGQSFEDDLEGVVWPRRLKVLKNCYNSTGRLLRCHGRRPSEKLHPATVSTSHLSSVSWAQLFQELTFGANFNQPSASFSWPPWLKHLTFSAGFVQPVVHFSLPPTLQKLIFGECFDRIMEEIAWPASLEQVKIGFYFNQPVGMVGAITEACVGGIVSISQLLTYHGHRVSSSLSLGVRSISQSHKWLDRPRCRSYYSDAFNTTKTALTRRQ